jgi:hypothetical protein
MATYRPRDRVPQYRSFSCMFVNGAFDTLSIPAMSAELERVFSQAKRFITDDRNRLSPETFEALMLLKHCALQDFYSVVTPDTPE